MKTKYRIKQVGNLFYPQKKVLFWTNIYVPGCDYHGNRLVINKNPILLVFNSLSDAERELKNYIDNYLHSFVVKGHVVCSYYDPDYDHYYYRSEKVTNIVSDSSEQVVEQIGQYEYKRKKEKERANKVTIHEFRQD